MDKGLLLLKAMKQKNINPDGVLYNSLLDGCVRSGVRHSFPEYPRHFGLFPWLAFSLVHSLQWILYAGFAGLVAVDLALVPTIFLVTFFSLSDRHLGSLACAFFSCLQRSSLCLELWQEMQAQRIKPSNFTLSILIKLHGRMRQLPVAFELVKQLPKMYDFRINAHVYTCLMAACIENRQVRLPALMLLKPVQLNSSTLLCTKGSIAQDVQALPHSSVC